MTFDVYATNTCTSAVLFTSTNSVSAAAAQSSTFGPVTTAGTYYVSAAYSGDADDNSASSPCTAEVVTVSKVTPSVSTTLSATSVAQGGSCVTQRRCRVAIRPPAR